MTSWTTSHLIIVGRKHKKLLTPKNKAVSGFNAGKDTRFLTFVECLFLGSHSAMEKKIVKPKTDDRVAKECMTDNFMDSCRAFPSEYQVFLAGNHREWASVSKGKFSDNLGYL